MGKDVKLKTKGIAFNILDRDQKELFDFANEKSNFSAYVKGLMLRDMFGQPVTQMHQRNAVIDSGEDFSQDDLFNSI